MDLLTLWPWPFNPQNIPYMHCTTSIVGLYPKVIPCTNFEHFCIIRIWVMTYDAADKQHCRRHGSTAWVTAAVDGHSIYPDRGNSGINLPADFDLLQFNLETGANYCQWGQHWAIFLFMWLFVLDLWANTCHCQLHHVTLWPRHLTLSLDVMALVSYTSFRDSSV